MYLLPQEVEVWYVIPAVRKEFARILTKKHNMTFEKAGEAIGVSKAAISQYFSKKRAKAFNLPKEIKKEIELSAERISDNPGIALREMMKILRLIKQKKYECNLCRKYNKGILKQCKHAPIPC